MSAYSSAGNLTARNVEIVTKMERAAQQDRTVGQRVADIFAATVGSWTFIIAQSVILGIWILLNLLGFIYHWDPYPFILLNLALSFQAAYAGPIIMMSQNRQAKLADRRNHLDLQVNLLAEQETTEMLHLLRMICERLGIDDPAINRVLETPTDPEELLDQIRAADSEACKKPT